MPVGSRLDKYLYDQGYFDSRNKAEEAIKLGEVIVDKRQIKKPSFLVRGDEKVKVLTKSQYVSRAANKLLSVIERLDVSFKDKTVLDIGSSTGGFTQVVLEEGAKQVVAVDVGTDQLHPSLRTNSKIALYEKTDIRDFLKLHPEYENTVDSVVADVSFISLRMILPTVKKLLKSSSELIVMCKPQFEAGKEQVNKGVIKNSKIRRAILQDFEVWLLDNGFQILNKADSQVAGTKGNVERFYKLKLA